MFVVPATLILAHQVRTPARRQEWLTIVRSVHLRHWPIAWLTAGLVIGLGILLREVPVLKWGWMHLFMEGGGTVNGSAVRVAETHGYYWVAIGLVLLLGVSMPIVVESEERAYRRGSEEQSWRMRIWRSFKFGALHLTLGIPLGVALAIGVGGFVFTLVYLRGARNAARGESPATAGQRESTATHLAFNWTLVAVMLVLLIALMALRH